MKILMINVVCGVMSTGRICTDLATAVDSREKGHIVKIAYGREEVPVEYQKYGVRIGSKKDVVQHGLKARFLDGSGFGSIKATKEFLDWVKSFDPDVIHLHNIHGYYIHVGLLFNYLKQCGKKVIWTLHDGWSFTGHTPYCDTVNCERWRTGCGHCPLKSAYPKSFLDFSKRNFKRKKRLFTGISDMTLVTPSHWLENRVKQSFLSEYRTVVIPNGIDTSVFYRRDNDFKEKHGISDKIMLLGVSTAWDEMKGLTDYYKLADVLGDGYKVVLVGLKGNQMLSAPENVIGITRTSSKEELAEIYSAADLFVNLTYCDTYPLVNLEARACGLPVLTYDTGGSPDSAGEGAVVVARGNLEAVVKKIHEYDFSVKNNENFDVNMSRKFLDEYLKLYLE